MTAPQAKTGVEVERLPELPLHQHEVEVWVACRDGRRGFYNSVCAPVDPLYTDHQMIAYATAALAAERAEIERLMGDLRASEVAELGAQSANRHLSALVDFERQVSERCMAVMKALMDAAEPVNNEFQDCHIDYADYAKFVDAHAELLYVIKNGERPAALSPSQGGPNV